MSKKVIIVGACKSLLEDDKNGEFIDSFDEVIRINNHYRIPKDKEKYLGSRTDIIYHCLSASTVMKLDHPNPLEWDDFKAVYYLPRPNTTERFLAIFDKRFPDYREKLIIESSDFIKKYDQFIQTKPHTGTSAIFHQLEKFPENELHAIGFSFMQNGYATVKDKWTTEKSKRYSVNVGHNYKKELDNFRKVINANYKDRFFPHGVLKELLEKQ